MRCTAIRLVSALLFLAAALVSACTDDERDRTDEITPDESAVPLEDREAFGPDAPPADSDDAGADAPSCDATDSIAWTDAADHVGTEVSIVGPVARVASSGSEVSISLGEPAAEMDPVEVILTEEALAGIEGDAEQIFGQAGEICAVGVVQDVQGNLQIVVNESRDVQPL